MKLRLLTLLILFSLSAPARNLSKASEQEGLNFVLRTESLLDGEVHYSFQVLTPESIYRDHYTFSELDSLGLLKKKDAKILLSKFSYVVSKPVGFFDEQFAENEELLSYLLGKPKIKRLSKSSYQITVPGEPPLSYKLRNFMDSDDISTVHHSRAVKSIQAVKRMDVLSQSASFVFYQELTDFNVAAEGAVSVTAYIPLKENRTLIMGYKLVSLKGYANDSDLKKDLIREYVKTRELINQHAAKKN